MAVSKTDLCNLALGLLDEEPIMDIEGQEEPKAAVMRIHLPNSLDAMFAAHPWNACTKRQALTASPEPPPFGFLYQFTLPADCILVREVVEASRGFKIERWKVEGNRKLLCNHATPGVIYTARIDEIPRLPPYLVEVAAYHLALRTARAITGSDSKGQALREELQRTVLPDAQHRDAQEGHSGENNHVPSILNRAGILRARRVTGPLVRP